MAKKARKGQIDSPVGAEDQLVPSAEDPGRGEPDIAWIASGALVAALAGFLRFFWLELKPLHHDEGVNGHFLVTLFRDGVYHYDPSNYHGPDLYFLSLAFTKIFGLNTLSIRWSVAIFGFLTVVLALYLKRYIGKTGSLAAALFLALSPGMVFISRYFIHEILFIFLSLAIVVAVLLFLDRQKAGIGAIVWMTLLLMVCFMPVSLMGVSTVSSKSIYMLWSLRISVLTVEAVLIFLVVRMLMQWNGGRPIYILLASASAVLLYATKETAFITHGTMLIAVGCVIGWRKLVAFEKVEAKIRAAAIVGSVIAAGLAFGAAVIKFGYLKGSFEWYYRLFTAGTDPTQGWLFFAIIFLCLLALVAYIAFISDVGVAAPASFEEPSHWNFTKDLWKKLDWTLLTIAAVFVFVYLLTLFFTSFFRYPGDITNFFKAYAFWTKTGLKDHTQNGYLGYVRWMMQIESPLVILSSLGTIFAVITPKHRFALFAGLWAFGLFLAYSIITYKTPWLALSFTLPMCIAAGYAVNELFSSRKAVRKILGAAMAVLATVILAFQTYDLNFVRYDDDSMPYVYAHTRRGLEDLVRDAKRFAAKSSRKGDSAIDIVSNEYWPLPWYFKDYKNALFHGGLKDVSTSEMIIAKDKQRQELPARYAAHYKYIGKYSLRPGVDLYLLVRNDLAGSDGKNIYDIER